MCGWLPMGNAGECRLLRRAAAAQSQSPRRLSPLPLLLHPRLDDSLPLSCIYNFNCVVFAGLRGFLCVLRLWQATKTASRADTPFLPISRLNTVTVEQTCYIQRDTRILLPHNEARASPDGEYERKGEENDKNDENERQR